MRQRLLLPGAVAACLLLTARRSPGCECGDVPSVTVARERAAFVLTGKIVGKREVRVTIYEPGDGPKRAAASGQAQECTVEVDKLWKGFARRRLTFLTGVSSCDIDDPRVGMSMLLFLERNEDIPGRLMASECLPSKETRAAGAELAELGSGKRISR